MAPTIGFYGAAQTVTGSKHLLTVGKSKILVDCGLFQGTRDLRERNWEPFPFDPAEIDAVVLTHAHVDHIGLLPKLVKEGFRGPIYCTYGTQGISRISLPDSARLQEEEAKWHNKHRTSRHDPALPLYTEADAFETLKQMRPLHYHQDHALPGGCTLRYSVAGHILGSAFAEIFFPNGERILMSGDLGRFNTPIIRDPETMEFAEYLVIESTYGDRIHGEENPEPRLEALIQEAVEGGLVLLIPSFSIGRTQELLYYVNELQREGRIPRIPIYLDSPMAVTATQLYDQTKEDHDVEMKIRIGEGDDPLNPEGLVLVRDRNQSKAINGNRGPMMVIAGSGMANGGRIIHHLRSRLDDDRTIVLFTGYQANGTLGRRILNGDPEVEIFGQPIQVRARVERMTSLSAHADQQEMLTWLRGFKTPPKKTFIVHGEPGPQEVLAAKIREELGWDTVIPTHGQTVELG